MRRHLRSCSNRNNSGDVNDANTTTPSSRTRRNTDIDSHSTTTPSSIRDSAHDQSRSSGSHNDRRYNLSYFRGRSQQSYPTCDGGCADKYKCDVCDKKRICVCVQHDMHYDCVECIRATPDGDAVGVPCNQHQLVQCTYVECNAMFHIQCVAHLRHVTVEEFSGAHLLNFVCHQCSQLSTSSPNHSWDSRSTPFSEKLNRFGLAESNMTRSRRLSNKMMKDAATAYSLQNRFPISSNLLNSTPKCYVPLVNMEPRFCDQHAVLGRRFEMSLFSFEVTKCHCCGVIKPQHQDLLFLKQQILQQTMFVTKMYKAMHCTCGGVCKGSQFYSVDKPTQMTFL